MQNRLIRGLKNLGLLPYLNLSGKLSLNEKHFQIPVLGKIGYDNLEMSELWMVDLFRVILPLGNKTFVDVGVNIGQTFLKLRSVSESMEYIGFEPNPQCVSYFAQLININKFNNSKIIPIGISDSNLLGKLYFLEDTATDSNASMIENFRDKNKIQRIEYVPFFNVNDIEKEIGFSEISVLKIDVEGAELEVLRSFRNLIIKDNPIILVEILPAYNFQNFQRVERQKEIEIFLKDLQYVIFRIKIRGKKLFDIEEVDEIGIHSDLNSCEYVAMPKIKSSHFHSNVKLLMGNRES